VIPLQAKANKPSEATEPSRAALRSVLVISPSVVLIDRETHVPERSIYARFPRRFPSKRRAARAFHSRHNLARSLRDLDHPSGTIA
jgi:hypothetical protein